MFVFAWIAVGALAGFIAAKISGDEVEMAVPANITVGVVGALLAGWIVTLFGGPTKIGFDYPSLAVALIGAIVLIWMVRGFKTPTFGN